MSRINTNVQSLIAQRVLNQNNRSLSTSLERLSTGLRINRGADDPAGLIASENLRAEKSALSSAISNTERAEQVINIAEGGLQEVSGLLNELQGLVTATANDAGLSSEEKKANQLQIDSILQTIDRLANSTSFQGTKLLNGSFDFTTSGVADELNSFKVNGAKFGFGKTLGVDVVVTQSAQQGGFYLSFGGTSIDLASGQTFVFEVAGALGSRELSFASGTSLSAIADSINTFKDVTGVSAAASGNGILIKSIKFGSDEFVKVKVTDDGGVTGTGIGVFNLSASNANAVDATTRVQFTSSPAKNGLTDKGQDVGATINGVNAVAEGTKASINTDFLSVEVDLVASGGSNPDAIKLGKLDAFTITGGGADFQLAPQVDIAGKVNIGIGNVAARNLGATTATDKATGSAISVTLADLAGGKALNVEDGDLVAAQVSVEKAIEEVSQLRGRLGAFQKNIIGATIRSLGVSLENTTAAESAIRDTDFAKETAALTRNQVLVAATTNVLGIANAQPQNALQLLG